jgi:hypothetical protein
MKRIIFIFMAPIFMAGILNCQKQAADVSQATNTSATQSADRTGGATTGGGIQGKTGTSGSTAGQKNNAGGAENNSDTVEAAPPNTPIITSPTHPEQDACYANNTVTFSYYVPDNKTEITGYSVVWDDKPNTIPGASKYAPAGKMTFYYQRDGVWNLHVRAVNKNGLWSDTAHFKVNIDKQCAPDIPVVSSPTHPDPEEWSENSNVTLIWTTYFAQDGYSYEWTHNADTSPDNKSDTLQNTITFDNQAVGEWYFHIRALRGTLWSGTAHYRVRIRPEPAQPELAYMEYSFGPNYTMEGKTKAFKMTIRNRGTAVKLTPKNTTLYIENTSLSTPLSEANAFEKHTTTEIAFREMKLTGIPPGEYTIRVEVNTPNKQIINIINALTISQGAYTFVARDMPYIANGACDFPDLIIEKGATIFTVDMDWHSKSAIQGGTIIPVSRSSLPEMLKKYCK